jgi:hypothetical protein
MWKNAEFRMLQQVVRTAITALESAAAAECQRIMNWN